MALRKAVPRHCIGMLVPSIGAKGAAEEQSEPYTDSRLYEGDI